MISNIAEGNFSDCMFRAIDQQWAADGDLA
jgi:hypothetical protein